MFAKMCSFFERKNKGSFEKNNEKNRLPLIIEYIIVGAVSAMPNSLYIRIKSFDSFSCGKALT